MRGLPRPASLGALSGRSLGAESAASSEERGPSWADLGLPPAAEFRTAPASGRFAELEAELAGKRLEAARAARRAEDLAQARERDRAALQAAQHELAATQAELHKLRQEARPAPEQRPGGDTRWALADEWTAPRQVHSPRGRRSGDSVADQLLPGPPP